MNVVNSSGWLEYFAGGANAAFFAPVIEDLEHLLIPVICIFSRSPCIFLMRHMPRLRDNNQLRAGWTCTTQSHSRAG